MPPRNGEHNSRIGCSFCGKPQREARKLIAGQSSVYICDQCVRLCNEIISEERDREPEVEPAKVPTPEEVKNFLDQYIIGQDLAKKVISVAVYNHYKRLANRQETGAVELAKSNVLLLGPTGCGKTLMAQTLARFLKVPFAMADATTLTEAGYVGEDVENIVQALLANADNDVERAQRGIVFIDEIDKIARKSGHAPSASRDVSGEGVQQALLKIIEGAKANVIPRGARRHYQQEYIQVDTTDILFICGGTFHGLDQIIRRRVGEKALGFGARLNRREEHSLGEILARVEPGDLLEFGMIPEFVGRMPVIATMSELTRDELVSAMTGPRNALVRQYTKLFELEGVKLRFSDDALHAVADESLRRKGGARSLRTILEECMLDIMYEVPYLPDIYSCTITREVIEGWGKPELRFSEKKLA